MRWTRAGKQKGEVQELPSKVQQCRADCKADLSIADGSASGLLQQILIGIDYVVAVPRSNTNREEAAKSQAGYRGLRHCWK